MIRNIPINKKLSLKGCWAMVNRVDTIEKANIAESWLRENELLSNEDYDDLMMALTYLYRDIRRNERGY